MRARVVAQLFYKKKCNINKQTAACYDARYLAYLALLNWGYKENKSTANHFTVPLEGLRMKT